MLWLFYNWFLERLVFTSDGVVVGVVIRSEERSSENQTDGVGSIVSAYDSVSVAYDLEKTRFSESEAEQEETANHNVCFWAL